MKLIRPKEAVELSVNAAWALALKDLSSWMEKDLVSAMVFGGLGIKGISSTPFYKFVSSNDGISQLGISKSDPPMLLKAYERSFKVSSNKRTLIFKFGDTARLKMMTPHPRRGDGGLRINSWMEWILDGAVVSDAGYVPRGRLPKSSQDDIQLNAPLGGLMLPKGDQGSSGSWRFPAKFLKYDKKWLAQNIKKIESAIIKQMTVFLTARLT